MTKQEIYDAFCALYADGGAAAVRPVRLAHPSRNQFLDRWQDCTGSLGDMDHVACYVGRRSIEREIFPDGVFVGAHLYLCVNNETYVQKYLVNLAALLTHRRLAHDYDY